MINVAALRPSDIERLSREKLSEDDKDAIIDSVRAMLAETVGDGGADTDRVFMAAQLLDMAGVWSQIPAERLADVVAASPRTSGAPFLEGLPHSYASEVALKVLTAPRNAEHRDSRPYVLVSQEQTESWLDAWGDQVVVLGDDSIKRIWSSLLSRELELRGLSESPPAPVGTRMFGGGGITSLREKMGPRKLHRKPVLGDL